MQIGKNHNPLARHGGANHNTSTLGGGGGKRILSLRQVYTKLVSRAYLKNKIKIKGWRHSSSGNMQKALGSIPHTR